MKNLLRKQSSVLTAIALCAAFLAGSVARLAGAADLVPLQLELPKPKFEGTPTNLKVPNLEPARAGAGQRPPLMVPQGTELLSLNKPVSGSDEEPIIGELEMVVDGDKEATDGSYVELGPGLQYVQIDLEKTCEIYGILIWHFHSQARVYHDVVVKCASDPDFISDVKTIFNNDHDNSSGLGVGRDKAYIETNEGKLIDAKGVKGRYVRLYSRGNTSNDLNHYTEVEIFGKPAE
ncbi:MAG: hypothetical protein BWZ10_02850 [candidate division BRC1 bacterium ADurb.BinA364]|nr:MAG: hypothetical protein BWZ10_02850 [candidate division BRC1 bacterium ADurb.BinA364]